MSTLDLEAKSLPKHTLKSRWKIVKNYLRHIGFVPDYYWLIGSYEYDNRFTLLFSRVEIGLGITLSFGSENSFYSNSCEIHFLVLRLVIQWKPWRYDDEV